MNRQHECMLESEHVTTNSKIKGLKIFALLLPDSFMWRLF